jgi:hypothetical protein
VLAMSAGYELVDRLVPHREATQRENCGGPSWQTRSASVSRQTVG